MAGAACLRLNVAPRPVQAHVDWPSPSVTGPFLASGNQSLNSREGEELLAYSCDESIWRDAFPGEPPAKKVRRIRKQTDLPVQDISNRLGLNRLGPDNSRSPEPNPTDNPWSAWEERFRRARRETERARQEAEKAREERLRKASEEMWRAAQEEHVKREARRERVNGKAGRGHPKINRERLFELRASGLGIRAIARELGCSHVAVIKIIRAAGNQ